MKKLTKVKNAPVGVQKYALPLNFNGFSFQVLTKVDPGTVVRRHSHDTGAIMRFIISGTLHLNGVMYGPGDWIFV